MGKLTDANRVFLDLYRTDPEFKQADNYMLAYPKCKSRKVAEAAASRLLTKPEAVKYLIEKRQKAEEEADLKEAEILRDLKEVKDMCMGRVDVPFMKVTKDGDVVTGAAKIFEPQGANKSLELLGKHKRMFVDRVENGGIVSVSFNFNLTGAEPEEKAVN